MFAGNIGATTRYEYTVVGDAVNESARLSEAAKSVRSHVLASGSALASSEVEAGEWNSIGSLVLRGRAEPTKLYTVAVANDSEEWNLRTLVEGALKIPATVLGLRPRQ